MRPFLVGVGSAVASVAAVFLLPWPLDFLVILLTAIVALGRVLWIVGRIKDTHKEMLYLHAQMAEQYLFAARAYDEFARVHADIEMPDGATQIVHAIAQTFRDLADIGPKNDEFKRRLDARMVEFAHGLGVNPRSATPETRH